jgi:hypothetical protein
LGFCHHARADVNGQSGQVVSVGLALTGVQAGPDLESEFPQAVADRAGTSDCAGRSVEGRKEAVPGVLDLSPVETAELVANEPIVLLQ